MFVFVKEIKGDNLHDVAGSSLWWLVLEIFYTDFKDLNVLNNSATGCEKALPMQEWLAWIHQSHSLLSHPNHKEMFMQQARLTQASEQGDSMTVRITVSVDVIIMLLSLPVPYSFKCIVFVSFFVVVVEFSSFSLFWRWGGVGLFRSWLTFPIRSMALLFTWLMNCRYSNLDSSMTSP